MLGKIFAPAVVRRAMLSKSLIQVSADGWVCVPSSKVTQSWNAQASKCTQKVHNSKKDLCQHTPSTLLLPAPLSLQEATADPRLHRRPSNTHRKSGSVSCGFIAPFP